MVEVSIISRLMSLLGIVYPIDGMTLLWDALVLFCGLYVVKYVVIFFLSVLRDCINIHM